MLFLFKKRVFNEMWVCYIRIWFKNISNDTSFIVICLNNAYKFDVDYSNNNISYDTACAISLQSELKKT